MARKLNPEKSPSASPAATAMDQAIELALDGRSPFPERATFIVVDAPGAARFIRRAADEGRAVVLVSADGSARVLRPDPVSVE